MQVFYEKFDHSKLEKFKKFLKDHENDEVYDCETKDEASSLVKELIYLDIEAFDESLKEMTKAIHEMNNLINDKDKNPFSQLNHELDIKIYKDKEVCEVINNLFDIACNRKNIKNK